jgi:hypothetical protein
LEGYPAGIDPNPSDAMTQSGPSGKEMQMTNA